MVVRSEQKIYMLTPATQPLQVRDTIRSAIEKEFGVTGLRLTQPTFFSRITDKPPKVSGFPQW